MKKLLLLFFLFFLLFPKSANAFGHPTHDYVCPSGAGYDCKIGDFLNMQEKTYRYSDLPHLCIDNKPDCLPRLVAKYNLKKYYLDGKTDPVLIGIAAHLWQDSLCPDHWYQPLTALNRVLPQIFPEFNYIESRMDKDVANKKEVWNYELNFQSKKIDVNWVYLDDVRLQTAQFVATKPKESLSDLSWQIQLKVFSTFLRIYRDVFLVALVCVLPFSIYYLLKWFRNRKISLDLILTLLFVVIFVILIISSYVFY